MILLQDPEIGVLSENCLLRHTGIASQARVRVVVIGLRRVPPTTRVSTAFVTRSVDLLYELDARSLQLFQGGIVRFTHRDEDASRPKPGSNHGSPDAGDAGA